MHYVDERKIQSLRVHVHMNRCHATVKQHDPVSSELARTQGLPNLIGLVPVLLQLLLQLLGLPMTNLYRIDSVVRLLQLDGAVTDVLACRDELGSMRSEHFVYCVPSISFQAFRKSSGSENATKPNFAYNNGVSTYISTRTLRERSPCHSICP